MVTILRKHQRGVLFRLGHVKGVVGPGAVWRIPMVDRVIVVDLNRVLPSWPGLSAREIEQRVLFIVLYYPEIPADLSERELGEAMAREARAAEHRRRAIELARTGQTDRAIEVLVASERGLSKDIAAVHLRFLTLAGDNTDVQEGFTLALTGEREKALPALSRGLDADEDRVRRWLEFYLRGIV